MYHPIRRVKNFLEALRLAITTFQRLGFSLLTAIQRHTEVLAAQQATAEQTLKAAQATEKATVYLERAERHSREQAGQRHDF